MLKQQLNLKVSQKLSPQQIQLMKMIQLSTLDLEQRIEAEMGENPALESGSEQNDRENYDTDFDEGNKIGAEEINIDEYFTQIDKEKYCLGKRYAKPSEITDTMNFLLFSKSSFITGQTIVVDGGFTLTR